MEINKKLSEKLEGATKREGIWLIQRFLEEDKVKAAKIYDNWRKNFIEGKVK